MSRPLAGPLAAVVVLGLLTAGAPSRAAEPEPDGDDCTQVDATITETDQPTTSSLPLSTLGIEQAQQIVARRTGKLPGTGVRVAVIDSGVVTPGVRVYGGQRLEEFSAKTSAEFYHGTAMAGVIAGQALPGGVGLVGIAPGAEIYDVRVYDSNTTDDGGKPPTEAGLVAGLDAVAGLAGDKPGQIQVVNVSLTVDEPSDALEAAVRRVTDTGAVVVASTGNRVPETEGEAAEGEEVESSYEYGENVVKYPAGYATSNPRVVAVGTTTDPDYEDVAQQPAGLLSSAVDVVVPTFGAVSFTIIGTACRFYASSTSVAAAEVSGVLALLASVYPDDTSQQLIARLETTATGGSPASSGGVDKYRGRGVVQPVEALTRPLQIDRDGTVRPGAQPPPAAEPAPLPVDEPDVLAGTRRSAVWWGLFGGGALVVALLLRPVLSRRRAAGSRRP